MGKVYTVMTNDNEHCFVCGSPYIEWHHIFGAANRTHSTEFGLLVPLCRYHHTGSSTQSVHFNKEFMDELHEAGQMRFEELHPELDFIKIFGRNYKR